MTAPSRSADVPPLPAPLPQLAARLAEAREILSGHAHLTPVMTCRSLDAGVGAQVHLKCENFQRVGAFKFRGAFHAVSRLDDEQRARGVITHSSGNHAQAMALVGRLLGVRTIVVMPDDAPAIKRAATEGYGAEVVSYDPRRASREELSAALVEEHGYTLVPPYDHVDIVAGQGTAAAELFEQSGPLDVLAVPCGGGGLLSGSALAAYADGGRCRIVGVEPELADDATRSFHSGTLHTVRDPPTIADGTRTPSLGTVTFPLVLELVDDMVTVSEDAIVEAMRLLFERAKLVVEPSGALGVAAMMTGAVKTSGRAGAILSGGNVDPATLGALLGR